MGDCYGQLSLEERIEIYRLHAGGKSVQAIGAALGRAGSTISLELTRNGRPIGVWPGGYDALRAQTLAHWRRRRDKRFKLARQPDLRDLVRNRLAMGMSPEQIAGRLARDHGRTVISHESIYRYVYYRSSAKDYWHRLLPRRKSRRGWLGMRGGSPAGFIKRRRSIAERPHDVDDRQVPGHWEADYMLFSKAGQALLVAHERQSRYTLLVRPPNRKADSTATHLASLLEAIPAPLRKTLTIDNGTEFAFHYQLTDQLGIDTFFCDVHAPWQKGGIENAMGRLRRRLPRKTNLDATPETDIADAIQAYNHTPRKCLDFKTPAEAFCELQSYVALQS
ncbi:IS30 family transposase [Sphingobium sp. HWE2-09]|uniref:IS30 family transposase n=1 Tax=Sphingobium sp. HWE2-09 TaxID=3108390 RepID=UPI002DCB201B|nr:IS30 family transposase [Sphingobium sp. HWE2-09]